jgi:hypothetical protein
MPPNQEPERDEAWWQGYQQALLDGAQVAHDRAKIIATMDNPIGALAALHFASIAKFFIDGHELAGRRVRSVGLADPDAIIADIAARKAAREAQG